MVTIEEKLKDIKSLKIDKQLTENQKRSLQSARRLARESQPIAGTLAEKYLREHRGINLDKFPESFRFHPAIYSKTNDAIKPALLVIAKDEENKIQAVQAIFLDERTAAKASVKVQKQTWGILSKGASVNLSNTKNTTASIYLAEGPETGLSIYAAIPHANVTITLSKSNFKNINSKTLNQPIVFCLDNDGGDANTEKLIHFAAEKLLADGKQVWIAKPEEIGKDYNDLLRKQGLDAVKTNIEHAAPYAHYYNNQPTTSTLKSEVLNKLNEDYLKLFINLSASEKFICHGEDTTNLQRIDFEKLAHVSSISQPDIDTYLSRSINNLNKKIDHTQRLSQTTTIQQSIVQEMTSDKALDL